MFKINFRRIFIYICISIYIYIYSFKQICKILNPVRYSFPYNISYIELIDQITRKP